MREERLFPLVDWVLARLAAGVDGALDPSGASRRHDQWGPATKAPRPHKDRPKTGHKKADAKSAPCSRTADKYHQRKKDTKQH